METRAVILIVASGTLLLVLFAVVGVVVSRRRAKLAQGSAPLSATGVPKSPKAGFWRGRGLGDGAMLLPPLESTRRESPPAARPDPGESALAEEPTASEVTAAPEPATEPTVAQEREPLETATSLPAAAEEPFAVLTSLPISVGEPASVSPPVADATPISSAEVESASEAPDTAEVPSAASDAAAYFGLSFESAPAPVEPALQTAVHAEPTEASGGAALSADEQIAQIMASVSGAAAAPVDADRTSSPAESVEVPVVPDPGRVPDAVSSVMPECGPLPAAEGLEAPAADAVSPLQEPASSPQVAEYRMIAPVELAFSGQEQKVGIRPGTPTFLKYQRLASLLTNELKRAKSGPGA